MVNTFISKVINVGTIVYYIITNYLWQQQHLQRNIVDLQNLERKEHENVEN